MGKDAFLKLLITQLRNQDPLNPLEAQEFAAQLAQFSSVEQLSQINQALDQNGQLSLMLSQSINSGVAAGLIGKSVEAQGNQIALATKGDVPIRFVLDAPAREVKVTIRNAQGALVRELTVDNTSSGMQELTWDGTAQDGARLPAGVYTYEVRAVNASGTPVGVTPLVTGTVSRVSFESDGIYLWLGELAISMSQVRSVTN